MWIVGIEVGVFEEINEDCVLTTIDIHCKMLVSAFDHWVWPIILWRLKWFAYGIMSDEDMGSG